MSRVVALDTNVLSCLLRDDVDATADQFDRIDTMFIPITVYAELLAGLKHERQYARRFSLFDQFLDKPYVQLADGIVPATAEAYADIYASLRAAGTPISPNDIWIAAECVTAGLPLFTLDTDFKNVSHLRLFS